MKTITVLARNLSLKNVEMNEVLKETLHNEILSIKCNMKARLIHFIRQEKRTEFKQIFKFNIIEQNNSIKFTYTDQEKNCSCIVNKNFSHFEDSYHFIYDGGDNVSVKDIQFFTNTIKKLCIENF